MQSVSLESVTLSVSLPVIGTSAARNAQPPTLAASKASALALVIMLSCAGQAWADPISFSFIVKVEQVFGNELSQRLAFGGTAPQLGSHMRVVFTANETTPPPDQAPGPQVGAYTL